MTKVHQQSNYQRVYRGNIMKAERRQRIQKLCSAIHSLNIDEAQEGRCIPNYFMDSKDLFLYIPDSNRLHKSYKNELSFWCKNNGYYYSDNDSQILIGYDEH